MHPAHQNVSKGNCKSISFVMESHGSVFLSSGLDAYLAKRYLPVSPEILARTVSTSTSSVSTASLLSDEDSPVFHRTEKITFVDMHTVASSSVSNSPPQDIMNTPKFQLRKMQRQMIKEQDYRDGLEKELADKISLITQRESHINKLQYRLDKMKQEQSDQELTAKEQINELETKNNSLQLRLHEILKENKDCKSNFSLMERKVNELEEENGVLSSQMRRANAQLSIFQDEVGRLTETLASGQEEWKAKMDYLQSELGQATAQKKNMRSAASTFGVGAENEPEGAPDDWMRIAELQARNKACLPHLKSSYPAEFEAGCKSVLPFTDEDVRTGDPTETIRRASVMLGQLQGSLASHCHSLAAVQASPAAGIRSHRLSLMADHPTSKSVSSSHLKSRRFTKRAASTLCVPQTSPEKKLKASCFPHPLTPKNKNINSGPSNSQLDPVLSPVNRRQSMMFTIDNTPKKSSNNYLKRGLNKLRSSTRKSPSNTSKNAMQKENKHAAVSLTAAGQAGRGGSSKTPQVIMFIQIMQAV